MKNQDTLGSYEKYFKSGLALLGLLYLAVSNEEANKSDASVMPNLQVFKDLADPLFAYDVLTREGLLLVIVIGGYILTAKYNMYLDGLELEEYKRRKNQIKKQRKAKKQDQFVNKIDGESSEDNSENEVDDSSNDDSNSENEEVIEKKKSYGVKKPMYYPLTRPEMT